MFACVGKQFFIWIGTKPRLNIMDPLLVKDILSRPNEFQKPKADHMAHVLVGGLFTIEGNTWIKHKKIINPAFHIEKMKVTGLYYVLDTCMPAGRNHAYYSHQTNLSQIINNIFSNKRFRKHNFYYISIICDRFLVENI